MAAYATPADLIKRKDVRTIGNLAGDAGARIDAASLLTDENVLTALEDASGEIEAALLQGKRYTVANLVALTGNSLATLKRICCDIAFWLLWERRPDYDDDTRREAARARQKKQLELLRTGQNVFDIEAVKDAGLSKLAVPTAVEYANTGLLVDEARRYYPPRRMRRGG